MSGTDGSSVVVTGAGRGIGRALALQLAAGGDHVVAVARTAADLESLAAEAPTGSVTPLSGDVADPRTHAAAAAAAEVAGRPRAWVNDAAVVDPRPLLETSDEDLDAVLDINLRGAFLGCREALRLLAAAGGGTILNVGSLSGVAHVEKFPGLATYTVSKAGVHALSEAVAVEGRPLGVRCICLAPGAVDTAMLRRAAPHLRAGVSPEQVAAIAVFLLSAAAAPLSGSTIPMFTNLEPG